MQIIFFFSSPFPPAVLNIIPPAAAIGHQCRPDRRDKQWKRLLKGGEGGGEGGGGTTRCRVSYLCSCSCCSKLRGASLQNSWQLAGLLANTLAFRGGGQKRDRGGRLGSLLKKKDKSNKPKRHRRGLNVRRPRAADAATLDSFVVSLTTAEYNRNPRISWKVAAVGWRHGYTPTIATQIGYFPNNAAKDYGFKTR